jgi:hypothetical protein
MVNCERRGRNIRWTQRQNQEKKYIPARTYRLEKPDETAKEPATLSSMEEAKAFLMEDWGGAKARLTSVSTRLASTPSMSPMATTPNKPKLKKLSPKAPGLNPG